MSEPVYGWAGPRPWKSEYDPNRVGGQLAQMIHRKAPREEIEAAEGRLRTGQVEAYIHRILAEAPPLTTDQVIYLRGVLTSYGPGGETSHITETNRPKHPR